MARTALTHRGGRLVNPFNLSTVWLSIGMPPFSTDKPHMWDS